MRKFILLIAAVACFTNMRGQEKFTLTISLTAKEAPYYEAFLCYKPEPGNMKIDSTGYADGKFTFHGEVYKTQRGYMYVVPKNSGFIRQINYNPGTAVYLENGNIVVSAGENLRTNLKVAGTPMNNELQEYYAVVGKYDAEYAKLNTEGYKAEQIRDEATLARLRPAFMKLAEDRKVAEKKYFNEHLNSIVALLWLKSAYNIVQNKAEAGGMFDKMSDNIKNSPEGKEYAELLKNTESVDINSMAPEFTAKDIKGEDVSLNMFRGKYVLLDFWASWCGPCRRENPNVLKNYNAYKDKNFTVLGFSMDNAANAWHNAVEQDKLPWMQISDLKGWTSPVAKKYGVSEIPSNVLIDPQGKIIAHNLRGEELEKKLAEILK